MTISKNGSRKISVGQETFNWVITPLVKGILVLNVQHDEYKGQLIRVNIESDINEFWIEFPNVESLNNKIVKPAEVATIITKAIKQGWSPRGRGSPLSFKLSGENLIPC
ncbi:hypothetical protein [Cohnella abietis]|uniref:Uncharacterized protein n=1 Tax=Cohnella abietis TaxID=2507935 RepID=A0A3T1DDB0_9BACL|nr:hypothetical protein [Cohnella abietis]BBI35958.1 hypothetical protein KCTCHS21_53570 [Cohnella abietis]